jgi:SAM-dependent methyltransferase
VPDLDPTTLLNRRGYEDPSLDDETLGRDPDGHAPPLDMMQTIERHFAGRASIRMLDAGCGDCCRVRPRVSTYVVGIDASEPQIARNTYLDEAIVAELDAAPIEPEAFDLVVSWYVLEHLPEPMSTFDRLIDALRTDGLLVLAWPNVMSVKSILARLMPQRVHVTIENWLYPHANLDKDQGPFTTVLDRRLALDELVAHAARRGVTARHVVAYECGSQRRARAKLRLTGWRWQAVKLIVRGLSGRRAFAERTDYMAVFCKQQRQPDQGQAQRSGIPDSSVGTLPRAFPEKTPRRV